jgi:hypothetical protein
MSKPSKRAGAPELTVEQLDRLDHCIAEMGKAWNDRFHLSRPKILERYLKGEICCHLQFRVHFSELDCQDFCACWVGPQQLIGPLFWNDFSDLSVAHLAAEMDLARSVRGANDDSEKRVFVGNVEVVHDPQRVINGSVSPIGVLVRLEPLDNCSSRTGNTLHYSVVTGLFKFLSSQTDGELSLEVGLPVSLKDERPNQMIQTRSKVVNDLANEHGKAQRRDLAVRSKPALHRVVIDVTNYGISARIDKGGDFAVEVLDILIGPLNLRPTPVEWM